MRVMRDLEHHLMPGRVVRDAHGQMWQLDQTPRWAGEQLRVRVRLLRCDGVWGDLPVDGLEPTAVIGQTVA